MVGEAIEMLKHMDSKCNEVIIGEMCSAFAFYVTLTSYKSRDISECCLKTRGFVFVFLVTLVERSLKSQLLCHDRWDPVLDSFIPREFWWLILSIEPVNPNLWEESRCPPKTITSVLFSQNFNQLSCYPGLWNMKHLKSVPVEGAFFFLRGQ